MKRKFREIMNSVLVVLNDGKEHSYWDLERKVNTNWQTVRDYVNNLVLFGAAKV